MSYTIKQHDTRPNLVLTLSDLDGPIDLTLATDVTLLLRSGSTTVTGDMEITTPEDGVVTYIWDEGDTDTAAVYLGEVEITWDDGKISTVPNDDYFSITIKADLNG